MNPSYEDVLANQPMDDVDEQILRTLGRVVAASDPVPAGMTDRIKFELTVAALHAEVAEITSMDLVGASTRGMEVANTLSFSGEGLSAMVTIEEASGGLRDLHGWVTAGTQVELREGDDTTTVQVDEDGRFAFLGVRPGLIHLVVSRDDTDAAPLITPGFEI